MLLLDQAFATDTTLLLDIQPGLAVTAEKPWHIGVRQLTPLAGKTDALATYTVANIV